MIITVAVKTTEIGGATIYTPDYNAGNYKVVSYSEDKTTVDIEINN